MKLFFELLEGSYYNWSPLDTHLKIWVVEGDDQTFARTNCKYLTEHTYIVHVDVHKLSVKLTIKLFLTNVFTVYQTV